MSRTKFVCPLGICSWIFGHHDYKKIAQNAAIMGFNGVELMVDIEKHDPEKIRKIFGDYNLKIFSMTPINVDIAHRDDGHRQRAIAYYKNLIEYALILNSPCITCHEYVGRTEPYECYADEWARIVDACQIISGVAQKNNVQVVFEPLNKTIASSVTTCGAGMKLVSDVSNPIFNLVLDTFHMYKEEDDACAAIEACGRHLKMFQIADSNRKGIGLGSINFSKQFESLNKINYCGPLIIECAVGINGPSLKNQLVDYREIEKSVNHSVSWIKNTLLIS